jgi:hypothetical protein
VSINDLGSLGEFIGSLAVLLTLGYLAIQTRATRQATDLQTYLAVGINASTVFAALLSSNPDAFQIWTRGIAGEPLDESELPVFGTVLTNVTVTPYASILHAAPSPTRAGALEGYQGLIAECWGNPNFLKLWDAGFWSYLIDDQRRAIEQHRKAS